MRIRRTLTTALIAAAAITALGTPAEATRVVPGAEQLDYCHDVRGFQSVYDVTYIGSKWRIDFSTARLWDCVRNPGAWS